MEEKTFSKYGFVYRIECEKTGKFYIGSTINLAKRISAHCGNGDKKQCFEMEKPELKSAKLYNYNELSDLREKEKEEIKKHINDDLCINKYIPNRNKGEYYKDNKNHILSMNKRKITCECGSIISSRHLARHKLNAKKHIAFINLKNNI